jgi:hypothetical protein
VPRASSSFSQVLAWICLVLPAAAADQITSATVTRRVLIVVVNPLTGDRAQLQCHVPSNAFARDVVRVEADEFLAVAQVCVDNPAAGGPRP